MVFFFLGCEKPTKTFLFLSYVEFNAHGNLFFELFEEKFCVPFWKKLLTSEKHLNFVNAVREKHGLAFFLHDQCMRGAKPVETLDQVFGQGCWGATPPPPCKIYVKSRVVQVKASAGRKAHSRTIKTFRPKKRCSCVLPVNANAAKIPDMNPAENLFNLIEVELKRRGRSQGWPKNKDELKQRIELILKKIPKTWFKNVFKSLPKRWGKCVSRGGKMTDFFIPKSRGV